MPKQPEDIFQNVEPQQAAPARVAPASEVRHAAAPVFPPTLAPEQKARRWVLLAVVALALILGLGATAIALQRKSRNANVATQTQTNTVAVQSALGGDIPKNATVPTTTADADKDGLSDEEERAAGTDLGKFDTDGDQLSDFDELRVYKTDPRKPDTDGDTNPDGVEVKKGYNPKGAGFLRDFQGAKNSLTNTNS